MGVRRIAVGVVAVGLTAIAAGPATAITTRAPAGARSQLDVRVGERAAIPASVRDARHALAERLGIEAHVSTDPVGGGLRVLDRTDGFLSGPRAGDAADVALAYVRTHADAFGLDAAALAAMRLTERTTSNDGVTHLTWTPFADGVPAYDAALRVHVTRDGRVVAASGPPLGGLAPDSTSPAITASQALAAAQSDIGVATRLPRSDTQPGPQRVTTFADGDRASLVVFDAPDGDRLAWRVTAAGRDPYVYEELVDAASGAVLVRHPLTDFVSNAPVYQYHPGAGSATTVDLGRWLTAPVVLSGPNAHAYADVNDNDSADLGEDVGPSSGTDWNYPARFFTTICTFCTWDESDFSSEATNRAHATTQLFYLVNTFHDWLRDSEIAFTSSDRNFETLDPVHAEADDSVLAGRPSFNNANMSTLPDGSSPTMQMYLWRGSFPDVNGSDDASVVFHEYTHGLSNRLIGNADGLNAKQSGAMGEGWSDWYAMDYLVQSGLVADTGADGEVRLGEYVTGDTIGGIRRQPLDCSVGSSAPACGGSVLAGHSGGFTFADLGHVGGDALDTPSFEVHDDGEIWSETLWDVRKALGGSAARRLITNAMRLSVVNPSFLDERDAILQADQTTFAGAHHDLLWQLFAARGMGWGARTANPNATSATASFSTTPVVVAATALDDAAPLGDGDGIVEPGERVQLRVTLNDPSPRALTNVAATLTTSTPGVGVGAASASWGTIAEGGSAPNATPFELTVPTDAACGAQVALTLHVTSDQGALDLPLQVALGSDGGDATFASAPSLELAIPEDPSTHLSSAIAVPNGGRVHDLRVTLSVTHTWVGDLRARLVSPSGTVVDLFQRPGYGDFGSGLEWQGDPVTLSDTAGASIQELSDGPGTLTGTWRPDESLSRFDGEPLAGTWTLRMSDGFDDNAPANERMLHSWSIATGVPACSVAAPSSPPAAVGGGPGPPTRPVPHVRIRTRRAKVNAHGVFSFVFDATAGLRGSVRFTLPKHRRTKAIVFGRRTFTVPASGHVRLKIKLSRRAFAQLRKRHRVTVRVTIVLAGSRRFGGRLTLVAPRRR